MLFTLGLLYGNAADVAINDTLGGDNIIQSSYMYDDSSFGVSIRKHAPPLIKTVDLKRKTQGHLPDHGRVTLQPRYNISRPINKKIDDLLKPLQFFPPIHQPIYQSLLNTADSYESDSESERSDNK